MGNIRHTFTSPLRHDHTCHLLYSTYSKYEEDWSSYPHTHYFTELFFVLSGSGSFLVEDETFPIAKHDLIVIIRISPTPKNPASKIRWNISYWV